MHWLLAEVAAVCVAVELMQHFAQHESRPMCVACLDLRGSISLDLPALQARAVRGTSRTGRLAPRLAVPAAHGAGGAAGVIWSGRRRKLEGEEALVHMLLSAHGPG